jgi:hypothetical protein
MSTAVIALFPPNSTAWGCTYARFLADILISTARHKDKLLSVCNKTVVPGILLR